MLTARLVNPSYGYQSGGSVSFSTTLELLDGAEVVATTGLSFGTSFLVEGWETRIKDEIKRQADEYIAQFKYMMGLVQQVIPTATKPQDAVDALNSIIESELTI